MTRLRLSAGISPDLTRARAKQIRDLSYSLDCRVAAGATRLDAVQQIRFVLDETTARQALVLDWRPQLAPAEIGRCLQTLRVNDRCCERSGVQSGHLLIPSRALERGENRVELRWSAPIRTSGSAVTRYRDAEDAAAYVYSLFVPAEASTVFPCFDQPDLKGSFALTLTVPEDWTAIANAPVAWTRRFGRSRRIAFQPTEPISTYVFAFAAGPFVVLRSRQGANSAALWVRRSQRRRAQRHAQEILRLNAAAIRYCTHYFARRFPFAKYDLVLVPQLPYRGMEHAGATFLNEASALLPRSHGAHDRLQRALLIAHETAHQWIGDLVTMRRFDDLWIKEGFANFMAYKLAERLFPPRCARLALHDSKVDAYEADATPGATALHHRLADSAQAKAAYNAIVYAKAPAVLRELERALGQRAFRGAVRALVRGHAFDTVDWRDVVGAFERASGRSLAHWARTRILRRGVPELRAFDANAEDHRYALIALDAEGAVRSMQLLARTRDALRRAQIWDSLWFAVQSSALHPARFVELALSRLHRERDEPILARVARRLAIVMDRLLGACEQHQIAPELERLAWRALGSSGDEGVRRAWLRALVALVRTDQGYGRLRSLLAKRDLAAADRLAIAAALVAGGRVGRKRASAELGADRVAGEPPLIAHCLTAASPDAKLKRALFSRWISGPQLPEHWITAALPYLNHPAHAQLTLPLLAAALDTLPELLRTHKIFFIDRWLGAFVGGQRDRAALAVIRGVLDERRLAPDLRLKLLAAAYPLQRAVAIRERCRPGAALRIPPTAGDS